MKNLLRILILVILLSSFVLFFQTCAFGSQGNSLEENGIMLETLLRYLQEARSDISSELYFYDDQGDKLLGEFYVNSNSKTYLVSIKSDSYIRLSQIEYWISEAASNFSHTSHIYLHAGEVVDASSSSNPDYNIPYTTAVGTKIQNFIETNDEDETGYFHKEELSLIRNVPQGKLAKSVLKVESLFITASIQDTSKQEKEFQLQMGNFEINLTPECNQSVNAFQTLKVYLRFKFSNLLKDTSSSGYPINSIFTLSDTLPIISETNNYDIYTIILNNLESDIFKEHKCE